MRLIRLLRLMHWIPPIRWLRLSRNPALSGVLWRALQIGVLGLSSAAPAAPPVLTLAVADIPFAAPVLIAESQGYFGAEGLTLKVQHHAFGRLSLQQLLDGQAHFATVADTPITFASFSRRDFAIVATLSSSGPEHRLVVRTDRGINSAADLKGKRIGTLTHTSAHYFTETFLRFNNVDPADISLVALPASDTVGALVRGEVDAAGLFDPHVADAMRALGTKARVLPAPGFFRVTYNLVSVAPSAGASDADLVKLLRALRRASDLIRAEPERARDIVAAALKANPKEFEEVWKPYDFRLQLAPALISSLEAQSRWALRDKLVPAGSRLPNYLDFIRPEPLRQVDARAVRLVQ